MPPELDIDDEDDERVDSDDGVVGGFDGVESEDAEREKSMQMGTADLGIGDDNGIVAGFDGVEDASDENDTGDSGSGSSGGSGGSTPGETDITIASAIEEGLAEAAAVGLEGSERKRVSSEMQAVASKFHVGYFGEKCAEKYLKRDIEDIPPEYGLVAALIAFGALTLHKRPDGDEMVSEAIAWVKGKFDSDEEFEQAAQTASQSQAGRVAAQPTVRRGRVPPQQPQPSPAQNAPSASPASAESEEVAEVSFDEDAAEEAVVNE